MGTSFSRRKTATSRLREHENGWDGLRLALVPAHLSSGEVEVAIREVSVGTEAIF